MKRVQTILIFKCSQDTYRLETVLKLWGKTRERTMMVKQQQFIILWGFRSGDKILLEKEKIGQSTVKMIGWWMWGCYGTWSTCKGELYARKKRWLKICYRWHMEKVERLYVRQEKLKALFVCCCQDMDQPTLTGTTWTSSQLSHIKILQHFCYNWNTR